MRSIIVGFGFPNLVTNRFVTVKDKTYFIGADSKAIKGATVIDNIEYFFDS